MPESFFILSKEHLEIAIDEITSIAKTYDRFAKIKTSSNLVVIQSKIFWEQIAKRATFVKISGQILRKMSGLFLDEENFKVLKNAKTFVCRVINLSTNQININELESSMGDMISKFSKAQVSLENPDITIYLILTEQEKFFGFSKRFEQRRPKKIKKYPHELNWKLTRAMINLIGMKEGETICDPFCGTGTTLLEAESMGIHGIGLDFDEKMCKISKENLEVNGYASKIINADFSKLTEITKEFDGIVTDLPYGMASRISESPDELMKKFVMILPKHKRIAIMYKKRINEEMKMNSAKKYEVYRHKSLTRIILIK